MGGKTGMGNPRQKWAEGIRLLAALIFLGYIALWMVAPTCQFWEKWLPKLRAETSSTYFGNHGTNLLIYTSSILLISILGCFYAYLKQGTRENQSKRAAFWKRPAIVTGPLGIVSWTELTFLTMFIALLTWYFSVSLSGGFSKITQEWASEKGHKVWQLKVETAGLRLGLLGNLCLAFLFFPVTRGSSILPLFGLTSEGSIKYHIWLGNIVMVLFTLHGILYIIYWASTDSLSEMLKWANTGISNLAGELALLSGLVLWVTTLPRLRRKMFELFFYSHQLYVLFLVFFLLHVGISYFSLILPGVYLFMIDRFLRFLQSRESIRLVSARLLPGETVELNFAKSTRLDYGPLSNVFLNVPAISKLQWHPFTVASNSKLEPGTLSVIIKKEGSWTQKLHQLLSSSNPQNQPEFALEGPYGPISDTFSRYDSLILISGGSGITPFISIIREFIFRSAARDNPTPRIHLVCAFKNTADLAMLDLLLPISDDHCDISQLNLKINAFVTRDQEPTKNVAPIRKLWFEPKLEHQPLTAVLGPHSWLMLASIIASSFLGYLILLGIMNRYYIYPQDHNSNVVYSYTAKALLNLLIICGVIVLSATTAFLWSKRRYASDAMQVKVTDVGTSKLMERELESLPQESLVKCTNVQFGRRPDLKRILMEEEKGNVGVLVSGPRGMRQEVGKICSSGLANNLHYESMSFSW
ncbi:ferric reduction oxidase 2-like [Wolffia australiana]